MKKYTDRLKSTGRRLLRRDDTPADPAATRPRDMTEEELREHKRKIKQQYRARRTPQKLRWDRKRDADAARKYRALAAGKPWPPFSSEVKGTPGKRIVSSQVNGTPGKSKNVQEMSYDEKFALFPPTPTSLYNYLVPQRPTAPSLLLSALDLSIPTARRDTAEDARTQARPTRTTAEEEEPLRTPARTTKTMRNISSLVKSAIKQKTSTDEEYAEVCYSLML